MSHKRTKWAAALVAVMFVVGACSNDSGSDTKPRPGGDDKAAETAGGSMFPEDIINAAVHEGTPKSGGTITFGLESDVLDIAPNKKMIQPADVQLGSAVYASLIDFADNGLPAVDNTDHSQNQIGESLESSGDLKTWTLQLRDDVKFANGKNLTAADVVAQTEWVRANADTCSCKADADNISSVEATGDHTVVYTLKEANVAFPGALNRSGLGWVIDLDEVPEGEDGSKSADPTMEQLVGAGPFKFQSQAGDSYTLVKNENYFGVDAKNDGAQLPYLDKLIFRPLADSVTRLQAVQSGGVQIMQTADTSNLEGAKKDANLHIQPAEGSSATILVLNLTHQPFGIDAEGSAQDIATKALDDPNALKARQAFNYGIDRGEINQKYYKGTRSPAYGFIPRAMGEWFDDSPDAQLPRHDAAQATKRIEELEADGWTTAVNALCIDTSESVGIFAILKEQADDIGIDATLNSVSQAKLVDVLLGGEDNSWDVACFRSPQIWDPNSVYNALNSAGNTNLVKYNRPDVDKWLDEARETADPAKRKELYDKIQVQVAKDVVYVPLLFDLFGNVFSKDVSGLSAPSPGSLGIINPDSLYYIDD